MILRSSWLIVVEKNAGFVDALSQNTWIHKMTHIHVMMVRRGCRWQIVVIITILQKIRCLLFENIFKIKKKQH